MCAHAQRRNLEKLLHLSFLRPTEQQESSERAKWCSTLTLFLFTGKAERQRISVVKFKNLTIILYREILKVTATSRFGWIPPHFEQIHVHHSAPNTAGAPPNLCSKKHRKMEIFPGLGFSFKSEKSSFLYEKICQETHEKHTPSFGYVKTE